MQFPISIRVPALVAGVLLCLAPGQATAAEPARQPRVQVTATRAPLPEDQALAHVTVITRADIEAAGGQDVLQLLRTRAGVDLARGGGLGQQASLFLRGNNPNQVLVLIDGVRVASANTGAYAWEHLPLHAVERIEIVRGPRAAVYGSDAIGGVIQIFTRRPDGPEASLAAGSHHTLGADAGFGRRGSDGSFGLRAALLDSGGFNIQRPDGFSFDPDDDGFESRSLSVYGERSLGDQVMGFTGLASDDMVEFDQGVTEVDKHSLALDLAGTLGGRWEHRLLLAGARETLVTPAFGARLDSRREQADWQHRLPAGRHGELLFGLASTREHGSSVSSFDDSEQFRASRSTRAGYLAWRVAAGAHDIDAALRHDHDSVFGGETTGQLAWGWQAGPDTRLHASHGLGFRAPNFNELYSPGFGGLFAGNPDLAPERSRSSELGLRQRLGAAALGVHAFHTRVEDLIDFTGPDFSAMNVHRARVRGVELVFATGHGPWSVEATATWQQPRDLSSGQPLLRRPDRKASVVLAWTGSSGTRLALDGFAAGHRAEFGGALPGYALLSASASWPLARGLALDARLENLFDRDYSLAAGFTTPGRGLLLRLRWEP